MTQCAGMRLMSASRAYADVKRGRRATCGRGASWHTLILAHHWCAQDRQSSCGLQAFTLLFCPVFVPHSAATERQPGFRRRPGRLSYDEPHEDWVTGWGATTWRALDGCLWQAAMTLQTLSVAPVPLTALRWSS
jgi:hypothetical protein